MWSTPLTCCSIGVATACSSASASAPTYVAANLISGGAIFGNCATGKVASMIEPRMTVIMAITIATIGRLMKNLDMIFKSLASALGRQRSLRIGPKWPGLDFDSRLEVLLPLDGHTFTSL